MGEAEPTDADVLKAAALLCSFCKPRVAGFLGTHEKYPHHTNVDALRLVRSLSSSCCTVWRGVEPAHWFGRLNQHATEAGPGIPSERITTMTDWDTEAPREPLQWPSRPQPAPPLDTGLSFEDRATALLAYLKARFDEEYTVALDAAEAATHWVTASHESESGAVYYADGMAAGDVLVYNEGRPSPDEAAHIARFDPGWVMAQVKVKVQLLHVARGLAVDTAVERADPVWNWLFDHPVLLALAKPYADRPDFDEAWRTLIEEAQDMQTMLRPPDPTHR